MEKKKIKGNEITDISIEFRKKKIKGYEIIDISVEFSKYIRVYVEKSNVEQGEKSTVNYFLTFEELLEIIKQHDYIGEKKRIRTWLTLDDSVTTKEKKICWDCNGEIDDDGFCFCNR